MAGGRHYPTGIAPTCLRHLARQGRFSFHDHAGATSGLYRASASGRAARRSRDRCSVRTRRATAVQRASCHAVRTRRIACRVRRCLRAGRTYVGSTPDTSRRGAAVRLLPLRDALTLGPHDFTVRQETCTSREPPRAARSQARSGRAASAKGHEAAQIAPCR